MAKWYGKKHECVSRYICYCVGGGAKKKTFSIAPHVFLLFSIVSYLVYVYRGAAQMDCSVSIVIHV